MTVAAPQRGPSTSIRKISAAVRQALVVKVSQEAIQTVMAGAWTQSGDVALMSALTYASSALYLWKIGNRS